MARTALIACLALAAVSAASALHMGGSPAPRAKAAAAPAQALGLRGGGGPMGLTRHGVIKFHGAMCAVVAAQYVGEAFGYPVPGMGMADFWKGFAATPVVKTLLLLSAVWIAGMG
ncbi:hypothetical protein T484DRAFT_1806182 [Baffinella frigidus]|nr:hypothetical protein T484DRAFT_1806182 [Cryptophyta sp. CCMP2293]